MLSRHLASCGEQVRRELQDTSMNHAELRAAVTDYFRTQLAEAKTRRAEIGPFTGADRESIEFTGGLYEEANHEFWRIMGRDYAEEELRRFFETTGLSREEYWPHAMRVLDEIRKARIGANKALLAHDDALRQYDFSEHRSAPVGPSEAERPTSHTTSLGEAVEAYFRHEEATHSVSSSTIEKRRAILDLALDWFGPDADMARIGKKEAAELKAALLDLPSNRTKRPELAGLSLREMLAVPGLDPIAPGTANAYVSALKLFWTWAEAHGYAPEVLFQGVTIRSRSQGMKERKAFTPDALQLVYAAVTSPDSKFYRKTDHRWATLIAMHTGARLNEVCQLRLSDMVEIDGTWVFDLNDEGEGDKRLKSKAGKRRVPVHSHLIELGLLRHVASLIERGEERLFPSYTYSEKSGYGDKLSKWFNRTLVQSLGIKSDAHVFHGLRHTFNTQLTQADVPTDLRAFIVGHEREGITNQVYGRDGYTIKQMTEAVQRFTVVKT